MGEVQSQWRCQSQMPLQDRVAGPEYIYKPCQAWRQPGRPPTAEQLDGAIALALSQHMHGTATATAE